MFEEIGHDGVGICAASEFEDDAHDVGGLVADIGEEGEFIGCDEVCDISDEFCFIDLIGDLRDDDACFLSVLFDVVYALDIDGAVSCFVNFLNFLVRGEDMTAGGEIGTGNNFADFVESDVGVIDHGDATVDGL